jgi:hypothetical protein
MFEKLKKTLFPGRHYGKQLDRKVAELHKTVNALTAAQNKMAIESTGRFRQHLAFLENPKEGKDCGISPALEFAANDLLLEIEPNGLAKTVVCTIALGDAYRAAVAPCLESHRACAQRWGFAHADLSQPPSRLLRHPSWYKLPLVYQLLRSGYERIAFFDADALITKPEASLEPLFAKLAGSGRDLLISNDESGANMGVFFAQASASLPGLLDVIWNYHFEQIAVRTLLDDWPAAASRILVTDHPRDFNSFPEERQAIHQLHHQANTWQPGDFVCHFSGIGGPKLSELIALYRQRAANT